MLNNAINAIRDSIVALGYIERASGLVHKVIQFDETPESEALGIKIIKSAYPVSSQVTANDCFNKGRYYDLVPDSRFKSMAYFETLSGINIDTNGSNLTFTQSFRCIIWLNLPLLGVLTEYITESVMIDVLQAINESNLFNFNGSAIGMATSVKDLQHHNPNTFAEYTYNNDVIQNMIYPFDYFNIDFTVTAIVGTNCFNPFTPLSPITCQIL